MDSIILALQFTCNFVDLYIVYSYTPLCIDDVNPKDSRTQKSNIINNCCGA